MVSAALCLFAGGAFLATQTEYGIANADNANGAAAQVQDGLISPQSYEEYLSLSSPSSVTVCEGYTAITDGKDIYVYDRAENEYFCYTHTENVSKVQFDNWENLYFLDVSAEAKLFTLSISALKADEEQKTTEQLSPASAFLIEDDALYYTMVIMGNTTIYQSSLSDLSAPKTPVLSGLTNETRLLCYNDELYYTQLNDLYKVTENGGYHITHFNFLLQSVCVENDLFVCTSADGDLYAYDMRELSHKNNAIDAQLLLYAEGDYLSLSAYNEKVYAVHGKGVKEIDTLEKAFTGYEICSTSTAEHRIGNAQTCVLAGDKLWIVDEGNARLSVYDVKKKAFERSIATTFPISHIAATETSVLVASDTTAAVYSLQEDSYGTQTALFNDFTSLTGVCEVYGKYYLIAPTQAFTLTKTSEGGWERSSPISVNTAPTGITADVQGNLYILSDKTVYLYTESGLLSSTSTQNKIITASHTIDGLWTDYEGGVYILTQNQVKKYVKNELGKYEQTTDVFPTHKAYVYGEDGYTPTLNCLAMGVEENAVYMLCDNGYITCSTAFNLPTVKTIAVDGADQSVFENASAQFEVVSTAKNALFVEFDLQRLQGETYFPYLSYSRKSEQRTALKIGETADYFLLAVFNESEASYQNFLVRKGDCTPLSQNEYLTVYPLQEQKTGYVSSSVSLYKFPYLESSLLASANPVARGEAITVIGEISHLDFDYYQVSYLTANGTQTGYIPKAFISDFAATPPQTQTDVFGEEVADTDSVRRLTILLLTFAVICILTDFLLLRKKDEAEEE